MLGLVVAELEQDMELVVRARAGSGTAFDTLFNRHKREVFNICLGIIGSYDDATDATQSTFIKAFRALATFRGDSSLRTWLYRIARNASLELIRSRRNRPEVALDVDVPSVSDHCDALVWEAMLNLTPELRSILVLFHFQGLSGRELAEALGCSEGAARTRLHRARQVFKEKYIEAKQ